jgi:predicted amidophosphoribosyltransferase
MEAIADPPAYNRARAAVRDDETARTMVQAFKYSDRLDLAPAMGRWMAQAGQELLAEANALIPVPALAPALVAEIQSGGNAGPDGLASERRPRCLSRAPAGACDAPAGRADPAERAVNVQGAFRIRADRRHEVHGQRVVLVDDVLTSGATLDTCARILLRAGTANVDALVFARVVQAHRSAI